MEHEQTEYSGMQDNTASCQCTVCCHKFNNNSLLASSDLSSADNLCDLLTLSLLLFDLLFKNVRIRMALENEHTRHTHWKSVLVHLH